MKTRTIAALLGGFIVALIASSGCGEPTSQHIERLSDPRHEQRLSAGYKLVVIGEPAVAPLIAAASAGSDSLRYICAQILGLIGTPSVLPYLRQLLTDSNSHVRRQAAQALSGFSDPDLVVPLTQLLLADAAPDVRAAAAQSLGRFRSPLASASLLAALDDTSASVRRNALAGIDLIWSPEMGPIVADVLLDPDETTRYIAAQLLGQHKEHGAVGALRKALRDSSVWVRKEAALALGELADSAAVDDLSRMARRHAGPDGAAARLALRQLAGLDDQVPDSDKTE